MSCRKISAILFVMVLFFFLRCQINKEPLDPLPQEEKPHPTVDSLLVGEWVLIDSTSDYIPTLSISGYQITRNGYLIHLAIESSTGKLAVIPFYYPDSIVAVDGHFMVLINAMNGGLQLDSGKYVLTDSQLTFIYHEHYSRTYTRSRLWAQLAPPIVSELSTIVNGDTIINNKVHPYPSAYAEYSISDSAETLTIHSMTGLWFRGIKIEMTINNFQGIGSYMLGGNSGNEGQYIGLSGDYYVLFQTDSMYTGMVNIDVWDTVNNRCEGTFEFTAVSYYGNTKTLSAGKFRVPVFR